MTGSPSKLSSTDPLAIVVVSLVGGEALERTLRSIAPIDAPCVVVAASTLRLDPSVGSTRARVVRADVPVPLKRAVGLALTDSDWVAFLEDTCDLDGGWPAAFEDIARRADFDGVGGPVAIASDLPPRCMALACLEYAAFSPRRRLFSEGASPAAALTGQLAGLNLLYRRSAILPLVGDTGLIETEVNRLIRQRGGKLGVHPDLAVTYREADHASATLGSRYAHGRIYGGGQRDHTRRAWRPVALLKCLALPMVLYARAVKGIPPGHAAPLRTRLWIFGLALAWSAGEFTGYLSGRGASLARWR